MVASTSRYPSLPGVLHTYDTTNRLVAFESGSSSSKNSLIFVGGLGDGLDTIPVLPRLSDALSTSLSPGWSLVQVLTRSSYSGWYTGNVDRDAEDLHNLEVYLREDLGKTGKLVLLGHSTGCQDTVRFFQLYPQSSYAAGILQAPVSDREYAEHTTPPEPLGRSISTAQELIDAGKGHHPLPPDVLEAVYGKSEDPPPSITASRWISLYAKGGKEDYFSSDLTDEQLREAFRPFRELRRPCCVIMCEKDETYQPGADLQKLFGRFEAASGASETSGSHSFILKDADHSITQEGAMEEFVHKVVAFLQAL